MAERTITSASIEEADALMPGLPFGGQATVYATTADGQRHQLFSYYTDELTFTAGEFVGLSLDQAHRLHFDRDVAYLRS